MKKKNQATIILTISMMVWNFLNFLKKNFAHKFLALNINELTTSRGD